MQAAVQQDVYSGIQMKLTSFTVAAALLTVGCATTGQTYKWDDATVAGLEKGMSRAEVIAMFGEPTIKTTTADGEKLTFKKPSDENRGSNSYIAVVSLGGNTGANATWVDALTVELEDQIVVNFAYTENVNNYAGGPGQ